MFVSFLIMWKKHVNTPTVQLSITIRHYSILGALHLGDVANGFRNVTVGGPGDRSLEILRHLSSRQAVLCAPQAHVEAGPNPALIHDDSTTMAKT